MNNPFSSTIYKKKFVSHFIDGRDSYSFDFIDGIEFYRHSLFPLYINIGRNLTKGLNYKIQSSNRTNLLVNKTCFIYDVPDYFNPELEVLPNGVRLLKVKQYPGYYIDLNPYNTIDTYLKRNFSKPVRYKLRKYRRRLENCFDIRYVMYQGKIEKAIYDTLFTSFLSLLKKRFSEKQIRNNNLETHEWAFYVDVAYEMILNGQATLFVIYDQDLPISITLNYLYDNSVISAVTVFDTDYSIFHVGSVAIWKQLEWCLENNKTVFDFSKGHYEYKAHWGTNKYQFEHHIFYQKKSLTSVTIAWYLYVYLTMKQFFRKKNLNEVYNKIRFKTKHLKFRQNSREKFTSQKLLEIPPQVPLNKIDRNDAEHYFIKKTLNSFIYLNQERVEDIDILHNSKNDMYYFKGKNTIESISYSN
jgi:hypothetical protein